MINYFAAFTNTNLVVFPNTEAVNISAPGSGDGTEFIAALVNDVWGRAQALLDYAGMSPDGVSEAPVTAQFLQALARGYGIGPGIGVEYLKNDVPAAFGDRVLLRQGQVVPIADYPLLVAACYCGDANNATAKAFYKTSDAGGTTRSTAGAYFVLDDTRGLVPRCIGNATVNARTKTGPTEFGDVQEDQFQSHLHEHKVRNYTNPDASPYWPRGADAAAGSEHTTVGAGVAPSVDGANGTPRTGAETRVSTFATRYGICY